MEIFDENAGWDIQTNGEKWSITTEHGDLIADGIAHGKIAHYISKMHNSSIRAKKNFREADSEDIPRDNGLRSEQCDATAFPYECVYGLQHTGPHVTYGIWGIYLFD